MYIIVNYVSTLKGTNSYNKQKLKSTKSYLWKSFGNIFKHKLLTFYRVNLSAVYNLKCRHAAKTHIENKIVKMLIFQKLKYEIQSSNITLNKKNIVNFNNVK